MLSKYSSTSGRLPSSSLRRCRHRRPPYPLHQHEALRSCRSCPWRHLQHTANQWRVRHAQRATVQDFLRTENAVAVSEFVEVESGRRSDRPQLALAIAACRIHGALLVESRLDRLSRDSFFVLGLKNAGIDFAACDMPLANRLTISTIAAVAEEEARLVSVRTRAALQAAKARGAKLGNPSQGGIRTAWR